MPFWADLAELVAPTRCAGCDLPGELLCPDCIQSVERHDDAHSCRRCATPFGALVCTECWQQSFAFQEARALGELSGPLHRAVIMYKDAQERRLGNLLGSMLGERVVAEWSGWGSVATWIPARREALARRGFDHGHELACATAQRLGVEALPLLSRVGAEDQRRLGRLARARNTAGVFSAVGHVPRRVLVVDDVMTTGATLDSAASTLLEAGASEVRILVVARAW